MSAEEPDPFDYSHPYHHHSSPPSPLSGPSSTSSPALDYYVADSDPREVDELAFSDNDSALGESLIGFDTETLASYITDYHYENGRRYHAYRDGEYWVCTH
jgi:hypothetical protein